MVGRTGGTQTISIGAYCDIIGIVAHEIGHALGFFHEQARSDRDRFINILLNNIQSSQRSQFDVQTTDSQGEQYDLGSVMHYGPRVCFHVSSIRH